MNRYDVIVVGGGHAGVEAAYAVHKAGLTCALVTFNTESIGLSVSYTHLTLPTSSWV